MDGFIIRKSTVAVPGVTGRHVIMHVSDSHLCLSDAESSVQEAAYSAKREADWQQMKGGFARAYGDPLGEDNDVGTREAFDRIMAYAGRIRPELLVLTGDTLEYMHGAGARYLSRKLTEYGGPYICVPGNHEGETLDGVWTRDIGLYRGDGFTVVGIDNRQKTVRSETLGQFREVLREGKPVLPVMHVPLVTDGNRDDMKKFDPYYLMDGTQDDNARAMIDTITASPRVIAVLCGHVHGYHVSFLKDGIPQICCSSSMIGNVHLTDICGVE